MKTEKTNVFAKLSLHSVGFLLCIVPPAVCTLMYFPLWKEVGYESCIAGGAALLLVLALIPLYKLIRKGLASYSSYLMWLLLFLLFLGLSRIADEMTVISFVGFVSNLLGAICFYFAKRCFGRGEK